MSFFDFILGRKPATPTPAPAAPSGGGLLSVPSGATQKAYQDYAIDMQSQGKSPLAFADWAKAQAAQPAKPAQ